MCKLGQCYNTIVTSATPLGLPLGDGCYFAMLVNKGNNITNSTT